ncbi:MAG: sensor histidine kinase, partial [Spirochaetaceae bacterium]
DNPFGEIFVLMLNYDMGYYNAVVRTLFLRSILITLVMTAILATLASLVIDRVLISKVLKFRIKLQRACEGDYSAWVSQEQSIPEYRDIAEGFNSLVRAAAQRESDLARHAEELSAAVNQRDVLLREIHHRVKNNLQIINSLIAIEQARVDPSSGEMFVQIGARVRAMSAVHEILYEAENLRGAQLEDLVERVFQAVMAVYNIQTNDCAFSYDLPELLLAVDQAIPLSLLMTEAFTNAMKYGRKGGKVQIQVTARLLPKGWMLQIRDNGNGFPDSLESSEGFGFVLMKGLAEQLDGTFEAFNDNGAIVRVDIGAML